MKIEFELDRNGARHLMKSVFMYNWVMNATKSADEQNLEVDEFEQVILGHLHRSGLQQEIKFSPDEEVFEITEELADGYYEDIQAYGADAFWEDLSDRLAERDITEKVPAPESKEGFIEEHSRLETFYNQEFETFGLKRLRLQK